MSESRERILACACSLYLEDGFDGFSMRKLARAVGVTAPALYRHYESKEKVLLDVVGEAHKILGHYLYTSLVGETARERFRRAGDAYLEFALDHPRYFQVIYAFTEVMGLDEVPPEVSELTCAVQRFWDDRVRECMDGSILRRDDPERVGLALWAQAYGLISLYLGGMLNVPEEVFRELYRGSFRRILQGLGTPRLAELIQAELEEAEPTEPDADLERGPMPTPAGPGGSAS